MLFHHLIAITVAASSTAIDPRAVDAADAFSHLCLALQVGETPSVDPARFEVTELDEATRRAIKPSIEAKSLWDVHAKQSDASMLVHYEPGGMCVVEVAEADDRSMRTAVEQAVTKAGEKLGAEVEKLTDRNRKMGGLKTTTSTWSLTTVDSKVFIMLTTAPEPKFMIQHVMVVSSAPP